MELKNIDTVFVKSNEWCINLQTQQPGILAGDNFKTPVPLEIVSIPYKQTVEHDNKSFVEEFVNVTDGRNNYRVLKKHIKEQSLLTL